MAARKANVQTDASATASGGQSANRVTKATAETEPTSLRLAKDLDRQLQWKVNPSTPSPLSQSFPTGKRAALPVIRPEGGDQTTPTSKGNSTQGPERHFVHGGLPPSPLLFDIALTPFMDPMSEMDAFMDMNGGSYTREDDDQYLLLGGLHNPLDFDVPLLPGTLSPDSARYDLTGSSSVGTMPGASNETLGSSLVSASISSDLSSRNQSMSDVRLQESPRTSDKGRPSSSFQRAIQEHEAVIAAQEGWPCFRCNPPTQSSSCPKTARLYLEGLERTLKNQDNWSSWGPRPDDIDRAVKCDVLTEPFVGCTRDKLLAITQSFLHKALETHRTGPAGSPESLSNSDPDSAEFIILPPPAVLEYFLRAYVCRFEPYYPFVPGGTLKPNELMQLNNGKASSLLLLLMIAQGAMATSTVEARYLTSGLTEACRLSLFDLIEKDIVLSSDPMVLRCALLFTTLAAWSGDKWHMDVCSPHTPPRNEHY